MAKTMWRETLLLWAFSFRKIPMICWVRPRIQAMSNSRAVIMIPFRRRVRNHVNSMYFGALCVGVDLAGGLLAMHLLRQQKSKFSFLFKDFQAEFLKRCESDTCFTCEEGDRVAELIAKAEQSNVRENVTLNVIATEPTKSGDKPVGKFKITLSIKKAG